MIDDWKGGKHPASRHVKECGILKVDSYDVGWGSGVVGWERISGDAGRDGISEGVGRRRSEERKEETEGRASEI